MSLWTAMTLDTAIGVYLALAGVIVLAILYQMGEMAWHTYQMRRLTRRQLRIVRARRHRISLTALLIINTANRIAEWRERYRAWRYGDKQVGDTLINRMEKL